MSCWVVPALAAEYWKISPEEMSAAMRDGRVVTKVEHGFTFVDVEPGRPGFVPKPPHTRVGAPLTYVPLTRAEIQALTADLDVAEDEGDESSAERPAFGSQGWAEARRRAGRSRQAPRRSVA